MNQEKAADVSAKSCQVTLSCAVVGVPGNSALFGEKRQKCEGIRLRFPKEEISRQSTDRLQILQQLSRSLFSALPSP